MSINHTKNSLLLPFFKASPLSSSRKSFRTPAFLYIFILLCGSETLIAEESTLSAPPGNESVVASEKVVVKITESGLSPSKITLKSHDGSVFFLNATKNTSVAFEMTWGNRAAHCASPNLLLGKDGVLRSVYPIQPQDFSVICFPETGEYHYKVLSVSQSDQKNIDTESNTKELKGTVVIE
jgi:hypothetical protein